jgi:hypothetical protein
VHFSAKIIDVGTSAVLIYFGGEEAVPFYSVKGLSESAYSGKKVYVGKI